MIIYVYYRNYTCVVRKSDNVFLKGAKIHFWILSTIEDVCMLKTVIVYFANFFEVLD
ncbi:hypothetical protein GCM10020331_058380 [Ectobacillus funiculus]